VVNERKNTKQNWFNSSAKTIYYKDVEHKKSDILVIPETFAFYFLTRSVKTRINSINHFFKTVLSKIPAIEDRCNFSQELHMFSILKMCDYFKEKECRILVHNQNMHYSFYNRTNLEFDIEVFRKPNVFLSYISIYNGDYLKLAFQKEIYRLKSSLDTTLFDLPDSEKELAICYMPRKGSLQSELVLRGIAQTKEFEDVKIIPIDVMNQFLVAQTLKSSMFFLSFSELEGFGLPPAEAMACGCYVIGFTGNGGDEFMLPEFCDVINKDDINSFIRQLRKRLKEAKEDKSTIIEKGKKASAFIQNHLSKSEEKRLLEELFSRIKNQSN